MSGRDDSFLDRWSRRKQAAGDGQPVDEPRNEHDAPRDDPSPPADASEELAQGENASLSDTELCEELGLPNPATMVKGDNFKVFFAAGVPKRLRNLALRRLLRVNPALGAPDDLLDYADDYTNAATALGSAKTSYVVGRGLREHVEQLRKEAEKLVGPAEPSAPEATTGEARGAAPEAALTEAPESPGAPPHDDAGDSARPSVAQSDGGAAVPAPAADPSLAGDRPAPSRRHMVFKSAKTHDN